jgi:hypothetical protein
MGGSQYRQSVAIMTDRNIHILCDGGLGNRLGGLVGGLIVASQYQLAPVIAWPENNWCGCSFHDLFDNTEWMVTNHNVFEVFEQNLSKVFIIHENQTHFKPSRCYGHRLDCIQQAGTLSDDLVYYHNKVPAYFTQDQIIQQLGRLEINRRIADCVHEFCVINRIDNTVAGLHLRKTENFNLDEESLYQQVSNTVAQRYFVCSDDRATQQRFAQLPNVHARPKTNYVEKLIPGDWYESTIDTDGRKTKYNINRDRQSVIDAFIDMLILSQTRIRPTVKSSFANFARYFAQVKYSHEQEKMGQSD